MKRSGSLPRTTRLAPRNAKRRQSEFARVYGSASTLEGALRGLLWLIDQNELVAHAHTGHAAQLIVDDARRALSASPAAAPEREGGR